jgi:hypothetical protein
MFLLLASFVGCQEMPTDTPESADEALFAKPGNKPPKDPPTAGIADPAIAFGSSDILVVMDEDGSHRTELIEGVGRGVSWSPDGRSIAYGPGGLGWSSTIVVADLALSNGIPVVVGSRDLDVPHPRSPSWSPLGDLIAYGGGCDPGEGDGTCPPDGFMNHIRAVPASGGAAFTIYETPGCVDPYDCLISSTPAWHPDGDQIAFVEARDGWTVHALRLVDVGGAPTQVSKTLIDPGELSFICDPDWSPDGSKIAFWGRETEGGGANLFVYDVADDMWTNLGLTSNRVCEELSWSPDGTRWVVRQDDGIRIVDADPNSSSYGQVIPRKKSKLAFGYSPAWRPCEAGSDGCGLAP